MSMREEVSYHEFNSKVKKQTSGHAKIERFCDWVRAQGVDYCWIDTCCIDKSSSAELSEAINSMYAWYEKAMVCCVYLRDALDLAELRRSEWFTRGWTLQELIAPQVVIFFNSKWDQIGTRKELKHLIYQVSRIDEALLDGGKELKEYSVAQIMSWAAGRKTSRAEDEAYCLLGLFGVNMPLLYGEKQNAFQRLQEQVLADGGDHSLFAWDAEGNKFPEHKSILALSPHAFSGCGRIVKGFAAQRVLFERTSHGIMVLIHRSFDPKTVDALLNLDVATSASNPVGLTIPLGCFESLDQDTKIATEVFFLKLLLDGGKWRRVGVMHEFDADSWVQYRENDLPAYVDDYVRIYVHHGRGQTQRETPLPEPRIIHEAPSIRYLHLRDSPAFNDVIFNFNQSSKE